MVLPYLLILQKTGSAALFQALLFESVDYRNLMICKARKDDPSKRFPVPFTDRSHIGRAFTCLVWLTFLAPMHSTRR